MTQEELAIRLYEAAPLWDHANVMGEYKRWPIAWGDLADYGADGRAKEVARKHAAVALAMMEEQ